MRKPPFERITNKEGLKKRFAALRNLPRFFKLVWATSPGLTTGNIFFRLLKSFLPLAVLYVGKQIIDTVIALSQNHQPADHLWKLVGYELGLLLLSDLFSRCISLFDNLLGDLLANKTSVDLVHHAAQLDLYQFENSVFYDKLERARQQTTSRTILLSQTFTQIQDALSLLFLSTGLVAFNPWLIIILIIAVIPSFIGETHFNERSYSLTRSWTPQRRELDYLRYIGASSDTAKEVKVFGLEKFITERFRALSDEYFQKNKKIALSRATWGYLLSVLGSVAYYGAFVVILMQVLSGKLSIGTMTFLSGSFQRMNGMLQGIMGRFTSIAEGALYLQDLFDFMEIKPTILANETGVKVSQPIRSGFTFENVSFKYPDSEQWAIRNLSFHLKPSEKLALVGENGAGKTTLVKLISRLYLPTEGRILLDGTDLAEYDLADLRYQIGIIFQDFIRYEMTVSDNIAVGDVVHFEDEERIEAASQKSLASEVVSQLPGQMQQVLGKRFKDGQELSGGQWQKVALARAYMRDAQLVILDEPTSALDARAEHEVFERFSQLIQGKMAILISHRFSTVRMADRILFLEHGSLLEYGSHAELLALNGKYAELFHLQAKGYA